MKSRRRVIGDALAVARARAGLSQGELARSVMAATGRSERALQAAISAIELGHKRSQPTSTVREWERVLGLQNGDLSKRASFADGDAATLLEGAQRERLAQLMRADTATQAVERATVPNFLA